MASPGGRRISNEVVKVNEGYNVALVNDTSPFAGGVWRVHVEVPPQYPYKSPSIGFSDRIFHPNIDDLSGSICLDVLNQKWNPITTMYNIFHDILPYLLTYPNPADPLNGEAAALYLRDQKAYAAKVKEYIRRFATPEGEDTNGKENGHNGTANSGEHDDDDDESDRSASPVPSFSDDEETAGHMDIDESELR